MSDLIGQSLGRYRVLEQLGEGGMATVFKAYDTRLERNVAIKIIRRGAFPPDQLDEILKRFEREAKSLAKLSNPNIVKVMDYGEHDGAPYLVLEYLPGNTLRHHLKGKSMPWKDAVRMLLPISEALEYAHEHGIIHRDIKPANILLTEKGQPMLSDFGIAKILENTEVATLTGTGVGVGTPEYMAPEQWTGQSTAQSDIYSLGVVFYEMISGRTPYTAETPVAILLKQANEPLPRVNQYAPDVPQAVENILLKALAKNPEDRYANMVGFAQALQALDVGNVSSIMTQPSMDPAGVTLVTPDLQKAAPVRSSTRTVTPLPLSNPNGQPQPSTRPRKYFGIAIIGLLGLIVLGTLLVSLLLGYAKFVRPLMSSAPTSTSESNSITLSELDTATAIAPTDIPLTATPLAPNLKPSQWNGLLVEPWGERVKMSLIVEKVTGTAFTGKMSWGFSDCRALVSVKGDLFTDITTADEQSRWALHPDFKNGDLVGTWLRWTQLEMLTSGSCYVNTGDWWYSHIRNDGHMMGMRFFNSVDPQPANGAIDLVEQTP